MRPWAAPAAFLLLALTVGSPVHAQQTPAPQPPKGIEGPDVKKPEPKGAETPSLKKAKKKQTAPQPPKGIEGPDVKKP